MDIPCLLPEQRGYTERKGNSFGHRQRMAQSLLQMGFRDKFKT